MSSGEKATVSTANPPASSGSTRHAAEDDPISQGDLTDDELLELFRVVDADHGGTISREELKAIMMRMQVASKVAGSEEEIEKIIDEIDIEGRGEIDPEHFIAGFRSKGYFYIFCVLFCLSFNP